jgi:hypothetical protein
MNQEFMTANDFSEQHVNGSSKRAVGGQQGNKNAVRHGHHSRVAQAKRRGYAGLDARTRTGKKALDWAAKALEKKGGKSCPLDIQLEIEAAALDLWLRLELADSIIQDARERGSVLNRRRKELPPVHGQYETVCMRFSKRRKALALEDGPTDLEATIEEIIAQDAEGDGGLAE